MTHHGDQGVPLGGARWLRCDLHVHTPLDPTRSFGEDVQAILRKADRGEIEPLRQLAFRLFDACKAAGLDLVALTDHNAVDGFRRLTPFLDDWCEDRGSRLTVLPGVEVTAGGERPLHILVLFEESTPSNLIDLYLSGLFSTQPRVTADGRPRSCGEALSNFLRITRQCLEEHEQVRHLLVPAHINRDQGIESEVRSWRTELRGLCKAEAFARSQWAGFQVCGDPSGIPELEDLLREWAAIVHYRTPYGELDEARRTRIRAIHHWPILYASDPKRYTDIGSRFAFMKMDDCGLEGVRLALLDPESRLRSPSQGTGRQDHSYLSAIRIDETDFFHGLDQSLHPALNTIIGGRGTGKSSLVELIRYALDRARPADFTEEEKDIRGRIEGVLRNKAADGQSPGMLLAKHCVEIDVVVAGRNYTIRRDASGITVRTETGSADVDVRTLLAPRILSQRQIAQIGQDRAAQRRELDALTSPDALLRERDTRRSILDQMTALQAKRSQLRQQLTTVASKQTELQTTIDRIELLEREGNTEVLVRYQGYRREEAWLGQADNDAIALAAQLLEMRDKIANQRAESVPDGPNQEWLRATARAQAAVTTAVVDGLTRLACDVSQQRSVRAAQREKVWEPLRRAADEQYEVLQEELRAQGTSFDVHRELLARRTALEREVATLRSVPSQIEQVEDEIEQVRKLLIDWHRQRGARRTESAWALDNQDADLRMELVLFGDQGDLARRQKSWFGGSGLQQRDWSVLVEFVYEDGPDQVPDRLQQLVRALRRDLEQASDDSGPDIEYATRALLGACWADLTGGFPRIFERCDRLRLDEIEQFLPDDEIKTSIRDPEGNFKPIELGSLGQRSTAVLSLLLAAGTEPLIIDQPEDDLDNQYVYRVVVDLVRKRKFSRQLILATHNPNIPVNGDAELILVMGVDAGRGIVTEAGSIDRAAVKHEVSRVMEGSEEAFELRRRRYGF